MTNRDKIITRLNHDYWYVTNKGYKVFGVFLQGSQNYKLDYEGSDIDTKCIVLPTFEDIVLNKKPVSTTLVLEDNSHIDLKDIRLMWKCFLKQNINFLEILFTEYYYIDASYRNIWLRMQEMSEEIAHYDNYAAVNCICGMVLEKRAALCHPYPSLKDKIDKYGYDNKQLHHILRCEEFLLRYINGAPYADCLIPIHSKELVEIKSKYIYNVEEAKEIADKATSHATEVKDKYKLDNERVINENVEKRMSQVLVEALRESILEDIKQLPWERNYDYNETT